MIYGIISDVHSNYDALDIVLSHIKSIGVERIIFLGDMVGYNAEPDRCVELLFPLLYSEVRGNHDKAVSGKMNLDYFNAVARQAVLWARKNMKPENMEIVKALPKGPVGVDSRFIICHGSPMNEDMYILTHGAVEESFAFMEENFPDIDICFFGHTHVPFVFEERRGMLDLEDTLHLKRGKRYIINPGSVGQPRDGNPRASFGIFNDIDLTFTLHRVSYPIEKAQEKIVKAGLPGMLAERLAMGY